MTEAGIEMAVESELRERASSVTRTNILVAKTIPGAITGLFSSVIRQRRSQTTAEQTPDDMGSMFACTVSRDEEADFMQNGKSTYALLGGLFCIFCISIIERNRRENKIFWVLSFSMIDHLLCFLEYMSLRLTVDV